jgi:hypothetical protein
LDDSKSELEHDTIAITRETPPTPPALPIQAVESSLESDASVTDENQALLDPELPGTIGNHFASNDTFVLDAAPTRSGRVRRKRDMVEVHACICGSVVGEDEINKNTTVIECAQRGCETRYFHLCCLDLEYAPKNWRCDNHKLQKRTKR